MSILMGWLTPVRAICLWIDTIAFSLIDDVYNLFQIFAENQIFSDDAVNALMNNIYILVSVVAFFRLAVLLVNSIIDPDKLFKKKEGLGNIFGRVVIMLVLLVISPLIFKELNEFQNYIVSENVITKTIIGSNGSSDIEAKKSSTYFTNAGKTMQKIVITTLIKPEDEFFIEGEAGVEAYLNDLDADENGVTDDGITVADEWDGKNGNAAKYIQKYVWTGDDDIPTGSAECKTTCQKAMAQYHQMINQTSKGGFKLRRLAGYIGGSAEVEQEGSNGDSEDVYYYEYYAGVTTITAVFLTWIMLSWSIDIAIRSIELAVLRLLSPLFIATIVDPKSTASGGYFNNWLKRYGKTYADLFLKLAMISLAILLISLIQDADIWNTVLGG